MKAMTLVGLLSVGLAIGAGGYLYFSINKSPSKASSARSSNNPVVNGNKSQNLETRQSNPFDSSFTPPVTDQASEAEKVFNPDQGTSSTGLESEIYTDSQPGRLEPQENIILPDTAKNRLSVFGNVGALTWEPSTISDYESIQIRLSGPDNVTITEDFHSGEVASIIEPLPDGYYHWQSVTTPKIDPHIKQQMIAVRESGDSVKEQELMQRFRNEGSLLTREQAKNNVQSGGFRIVNGQILDGDIRE